MSPLAAGQVEAAWDLFLERYRRLLFGAIRHKVSDADDVMDVFARVCEGLRENDFARLRRCAERFDPNRPLSTWLVAVVHNLTIDWLRHRNGRPRLSAAAAALPPLQKRIFHYVFVEQRPHLEAYELLRTRDGSNLAFGDFLHELSATYRAATAGRGGRLVAELSLRPAEPTSDSADDDPAVLAERHARLVAALESLSPEDRLAVQLFIVDEIPAEQVARILGLANAKAVYNRVHRALGAVRGRLERAGIREGDL